MTVAPQFLSEAFKSTERGELTSVGCDESVSLASSLRR